MHAYRLYCFLFNTNVFCHSMFKNSDKYKTFTVKADGHFSNDYKKSMFGRAMQLVF